MVFYLALTAIVGTLLASPGLPPFYALVWGNLGIACAAACAAVINHVLDRRIDEQMGRTRGRPLPTGRLTETRALVFADGMTGQGGELRVWNTPSLEARAIPALRALLELPFEHVIVSHGEPVHDRAAFERALELDPWDD